MAQQNVFIHSLKTLLLCSNALSCNSQSTVVFIGSLGCTGLGYTLTHHIGQLRFDCLESSHEGHAFERSLLNPYNLDETRRMSDQLIIQGLPDIDEIELHKFISSRRAGSYLDSCVIIRDRETKRSRGFGFLQFADSHAARQFRDEWRDGIDLDGYHLRIDFSRDSRSEGNSWICDNSNCRASNYPRREVCFKCERPRAETDFSKDTSSFPSQFLQLRDLPLETTPQQINIAITKLPDVKVRRILLVDGRENEHVPIAFVEFQDSNAAARTLALAADLPGKGFSVRGKPVALSFIHGGVFVPVYGKVESGVFKATDSDQLLSYWNPEYHCSVYIPEGAITEEELLDDSRKRKDTADLNNNKRKKSKPLTSGVTIKSGSGGMISHWSKKQDELNGDVSVPAPNKEVTYADLKIMACLLCSRKFKSEVELEQHELQSDLHRTNRANPVLVAKAQERLRARNSVPVNQPDSAPLDRTEKSDPSHEYRDRALERRTQIKQSGGIVERPTAKRKNKEQTRDVSPVAEKIESKGSRLMNKMGYVSGGLGTNGQGRAEIVKADTYVPGAGLGSVGGKLDEKEAEARRGASTYSAFVASVKENARSRYENERR